MSSVAIVLWIQHQLSLCFPTSGPPVTAPSFPQDVYYINADTPIHTDGCLNRVRSLVEGNVDIILGVGVGLLVFQLLNIMLAGGEGRGHGPAGGHVTD